MKELVEFFGTGTVVAVAVFVVGGLVAAGVMTFRASRYMGVFSEILIASKKDEQ